jgi:hypothetical protein
MPFPAGANPTPHPRPRRAPIATLLALAALATIAQALAPAGAAAMIAEPPTPTTCAAMMGSWINGACYIVDDAGNPVIKVNEISWATPGTPSGTRDCPICGVRMPNQLADGAGKGGEKGPQGGSKGKGPGEVKPVKAPPKDRAKKAKVHVSPRMKECMSLLQKLKEQKASFDSAANEFKAATHGEGTADWNAVMNLLAKRDAARGKFVKTLSRYNAGACEPSTGPAPPAPVVPE